MSLGGINPETFSVPSGQVLLYQSESTIYKKNSSNLVESSSVGILNYLGVDVADLPCLVYASDIQNASVITPVDTTLSSVGSTAKAEHAYVNFIANRKVDKQVFLNTLSTLNDAMNAVIRTVTTMPTASSVPAGTVVMYTGIAGTYNTGSLYINTNNAWTELTLGGASTSALEALIAANTTRIVVLEYQVGVILESLGLSSSSVTPSTTPSGTPTLESLISDNTSRIATLEEQVQLILEHLGLSLTPADAVVDAEAYASQAGEDAEDVSDLADEATEIGGAAETI